MIQSEKELSQWLPKLKDAAWIAVDTEADSLHAYPEKICLFQFSLPSGDYLIDPLAEIDLDPLWAALEARTLIMHGADYDLRLMKRIYQFVPTSIFDTMLAASMLGYKQLGLSNLVDLKLGRELEKSSQKANWARRPLTEKMVAYAMNDTRYLQPLAHELANELDVKGRLDWHEQWCLRLIADCAKVSDPDPDLVWRIKGSRKLTRRALAVLRSIWHWREKQAIQANRPLFFILNHETLLKVSMAAAEGKNCDKLLPKKWPDTRKEEFLHEVQKGMEIPDADLPKHPPREKRPRPSKEETERFEKLQAHRDSVASQLEIDPTIIASKATLSSLAQNWEQNSQLLMPWQKQILEKA